MRNTSLFQPGDSGLHRLHPLTKLAIAGVSMVAAATLPNTWLVFAYYFVVLLPLAIWGRLGKRFLLTCVKIIWPFMLSLFPIQGFFGNGTTVIYQLGRFTLKLEGVLTAADYTARILLGIGAAMLLMFVTRPDHLMQGLKERGFSYKLGYIVVTTLQIIPRFQDKAQMILNAQRSRGLETEGSMLHRGRMLFPLISPLILGSIIDIDERAIALEARAFNHPGEKTHLFKLTDSGAQKNLRWMLLAAMAILIILRVWLWLR